MWRGKLSEGFGNAPNQIFASPSYLALLMTIIFDKFMHSRIVLHCKERCDAIVNNASTS